MSGRSGSRVVSSFSLGKVEKVGKPYEARISISHLPSPILRKVGNSSAEEAAPARCQETRSGLVAVWFESLERLSPEEDPCPGFRTGHWRTARASSLAFIEQFGEQAAALGWTTRELFGVDPEVGIVRVDQTGALMLTGRNNVVALTAETIRYDDELIYRRAPRGLAVPVWDFRHNSQETWCLPVTPTQLPPLF